MSENMHLTQVEDDLKEDHPVDEHKQIKPISEKEDTGESFSPNKYINESQKKKDARFFETVEEFLGELKEGYKISIWRKQPVWAKGHIVTWEIDLDDYGNPVVDIEHIKGLYGGHQLQLRMLNPMGRFVCAKTIDLFAYPPRLNSIVLKSPDEKEREDQMRLEQMRFSQNANSGTERIIELMIGMINSNQKKGDDEVVKYLREQNDKLNSEKLQVLIDRMDKQQPDMLQQIKQLKTFAKDFKGMFGDDEPKQEAESNEILDVVKGALGVLNQPSMPFSNPLAPPVAPPVAPSAPLAIPTVPMPTKKTPDRAFVDENLPIMDENIKKNVETNTEDDTIEGDTLDNEQEDEDIIDVLVSMDNEELAGVVADVMESIPEDRRQSLIVALAKTGVV